MEIARRDPCKSVMPLVHGGHAIRAPIPKHGVAKRGQDVAFRNTHANRERARCRGATASCEIRATGPPVAFSTGVNDPCEWMMDG